MKGSKRKIVNGQILEKAANQGPYILGIQRNILKISVELLFKDRK